MKDVRPKSANPQDAGTAFAEGLDLNRLPPAQMTTFLQGFGRRLQAHLALVDETNVGRPVVIDEMVNSIADTLSSVIERFKSSGYLMDNELADYTPPGIEPGSAEARASAAALELARRVAAVSPEGWQDQPDLLTLLREQIAQVAKSLRDIETVQNSRS